MKIFDIIKGSEYDLSLFTNEQVKKIDASIIERTDKGVKKYYLPCIVRKKDIEAKPEEAHLQSSVFKLSKDLIDSIHEEGIVAYTS
jgi:type I restriction enzyme M protein